MSKRIVFQIEGFPVSVLIPVLPQYIEPGVELSVEQIGQKDVPVGVPFWVVDATSVPADRTFRDAWELNTAALGEPSGIGGTYRSRGAV